MSDNRKFDQPCALAPRSWGLLVKCPRGAPPRLLGDRCGRQFLRCMAGPPQSKESNAVTADYRFYVDILINMEKSIFRWDVIPVCSCERIVFLRIALFKKWGTGAHPRSAVGTQRKSCVVPERVLQPISPPLQPPT